jgi:putative DNA primase/helicase
MQIDAEQLLQDTDILKVVERYVPLKRQGGEHVGTCPFHDDHKASLQVNSKKQIYKCFACGAGGDAIDFLTRMGRTFHEAVEEINVGVMPESVEPEKRAAAVPKPNSWKHVVPAPPDPWKKNNIIHYRHGKPNLVWEYTDEVGQTIGFVCRFDTEHGKEVLPHVFATDGTRSEWRWMGFDKPRPLFNLFMVAQNPNATIVVVEGEKTASACFHHFDPQRTVVTTWIGGANGIDNADFTPLQGRKVVFWPDNDAPGRKAMHLINEKLKDHCPTRKWINVPAEYPEKWDAADKIWGQGELLKFIKENMVDIPEQDPEPEPTPEPPKPPKKPKPEGPKNPPLPPEAPQDKENLEHLDNPHYRMLGYDKDENSRLVYSFFSFDAKAVIKLSPTSMSKANLMMLAPLNYWEVKFPGSGKSKVDLDAATQFLMLNSHKVGPFKEKFIRGRGAWEDEGRYIVHTGDMLIVNLELSPLKNFRSKYVYEIGERLGYGTRQPLMAHDSAKLIEHAKWLMWEREINAYLLAGWCVIAPFCGILQWRPHIWVTGPAGAGKSWVMDNIVKRLLGETAIVVQGKTTEAGVRGLLQNDARPVLFDESDVDSHNDKERVQNVLALARSSSYHDGGLIGKGTQNGSSKTYTMRSCFAFSSIGVQLNQQSDRSRFTMLGLIAFEGKRTKEEFVDFDRKWNDMATPEFVSSLQARTIGMLPIILKNARVFADAVAHVIGQRRIGDQVGGMLAGAYSLTSAKEITFDEAIKWVEARDWSDEKSLELTKDEYQLFGKLMGHITRVESQYGNLDRSIGEVVLIAAGLKTELGVSRDTADARLRRLGLMIRDNRLLVSNSSDAVLAIIRDTSWSNNYNKILERLPGAEKVEPRTYFPGLKSRGISIPLSLLSDGVQETMFP